MTDTENNHPGLGKQIPEPLATDAATARRPLGPCAACRCAILRGQRFARLVPGGQAAHVSCVTRLDT